MPDAKPHQSELRRCRVSIAGATYFLTICVQRPCNRLASDVVFAAVRERWTALEHLQTWHVEALQLMPDHVHLLVRLGQSIELGDVIRSFKGPLTPFLRVHGLKWQAGGYFDHRLRSTDERGPILRYMLTNPYRKGLLAWSDVWPYWYCSPEVVAWFEPTTNNGRPFPEWVSERAPGSGIAG